MIAILYCSDDAPLIEGARDLFSHIQSCPHCEWRATHDQAPLVIELFQKLAAITSEDIHPYDYDGAIAFCNVWLHHHGIISLLDVGGQHGTA